MIHIARIHTRPMPKPRPRGGKGRFYMPKKAGARCEPWLGRIDPQGYGRIRGGAHVHRVLWEGWYGAIPKGLEIDHACHNDTDCPGGATCPHRRCITLAHLELVTHRENVQRGNAGLWIRGPLCVDGHALEGDNLYVTPDGRRQCRECGRRRSRELYRRKVGPDGR